MELLWGKKRPSPISELPNEILGTILDFVSDSHRNSKPKVTNITETTLHAAIQASLPFALTCSRWYAVHKRRFGCHSLPRMLRSSASDPEHSLWLRSVRDFLGHRQWYLCHSRWHFVPISKRKWWVGNAQSAPRCIITRENRTRSCKVGAKTEVIGNRHPRLVAKEESNRCHFSCCEGVWDMICDFVRCVVLVVVLVGWVLWRQIDYRFVLERTVEEGHRRVSGTLESVEGLQKRIALWLFRMGLLL